MEAWLLTVIGGLIVVLIGLGVEYGIIQRRRRNNIYSDELSWTKAIEKGFNEFRALHPRNIVEIESSEVKDDVGIATLKMSNISNGHKSYHAITINNTGKIIAISPVIIKINEYKE